MFKKLKNIYNIIYLRILFYLHGIKKSKNFPIEIKEEEKEIIELSSKYTMTDTITMWALIQSIKNVIQNKIDGDFVECGGEETSFFAKNTLIFSILKRKYMALILLREW